MTITPGARWLPDEDARKRETEEALQTLTKAAAEAGRAMVCRPEQAYVLCGTLREFKAWQDDQRRLAHHLQPHWDWHKAVWVNTALKLRGVRIKTMQQIIETGRGWDGYTHHAIREIVDMLEYHRRLTEGITP